MSYVEEREFGNFPIPLLFYVRSILAVFRVLNSVVLTLLAALNIEFLANFDIFKCEITRRYKIQNLKIVKMAILTLSNQPKLISRIIKSGRSIAFLCYLWYNI